MKRGVLLLYLLLFVVCSCHTSHIIDEQIEERDLTPKQKHTYTTESYIERYKDMAMWQMRKYGVPASITLAQGILESNSGNSKLACEANNHFGIKCKSDWHGDRYFKDDEEKNDCYRMYKIENDSYADHVEFLHKDRYANLFSLKKRDYKGWAYGLKKDGYATNPKYPQLLINLIEKYELYKYDK